jgi:hypothetical protein
MEEIEDFVFMFDTASSKIVQAIESSELSINVIMLEEGVRLLQGAILLCEDTTGYCYVNDQIGIVKLCDSDEEQNIETSSIMAKLILSTTRLLISGEWCEDDASELNENVSALLLNFEEDMLDGDEEDIELFAFRAMTWLASAICSIWPSMLAPIT